jgi:mannose-6-phosphate isomerase-like protein (cupin superfamily)
MEKFMKKLRLKNLDDVNEGHILNNVMPGKFIYKGGLAFGESGKRSHSNDGPGGKDFHVHDDCEAFIVIQGKGSLEVNKAIYTVVTGDIIIIEPGEDHHLITNNELPFVVLWFHAGPEI